MSGAVNVRKPATHARQLWLEVVKHRTLLLMVLPAFLYFLVFRYGPILGISIAFLDFRARVGQTFFQSVTRSRWVGLDNFRDFLTSMTGLQILAQHAPDQPLQDRLRLPGPRHPGVAAERGAGEVFQTRGPDDHLSPALHLVGHSRRHPAHAAVTGLWTGCPAVPLARRRGDQFHGRRAILPRTARGVGYLAGAGWGSVIYLAALSGLDPQLYEAATIDGAAVCASCSHITLPGIASTIVVMLILRTGAILDAGFDQVFNLQNAAVVSVSDILDTHIYSAGIQNARFSYTTAVGLFKSVFGFLMVVTTNFVAKRLGQQGIM